MCSGKKPRTPKPPARPPKPPDPPPDPLQVEEASNAGRDAARRRLGRQSLTIELALPEVGQGLTI